MNDHPIIFSAPMVLALLEGRKTMTRRLAWRPTKIAGEGRGRTTRKCDSCTEVFEGESAEWNVVWAAAKRDGWRTRKIADEWLHGCPKCGVPT